MPPRVHVYESRVGRVDDRSRTVRAVVPEPIAALLGLEHGDRLAWAVEPGTGRVTVDRARVRAPKRQ